jgi:hypothetical protein
MQRLLQHQQLCCPLIRLAYFVWVFNFDTPLACMAAGEQCGRNPLACSDSARHPL